MILLTPPTVHTYNDWLQSEGGHGVSRLVQSAILDDSWQVFTATYSQKKKIIIFSVLFTLNNMQSTS